MTEQRTDLDSLRKQADDPTEEQILAEIEVTRTQMSGTIDEIGHRLDPQVIADQAREQIREATVGRVERIVNDAGDTAQQTGNTIIGTIRENPLPAGLAAIGIGWLALRMRGQQQSHSQQRAHSYARRPQGDWYAYDSATGQSRYGVREAYGTGVPAGGRATDGERGTDSDSNLGERGREMGEQAQQAARDMSEQAQEAARDMSEQAQATWQDVQWQAQEQTQNIQRQFDRTLDENPLALGALAVGVGAAVALAIPETEKERELMGEQRDQLLSEVEGVASRALGEAEQAARETGEKAREESRT
jgi:ElaB/YqjD/DUF883 family membrane-anchored ribosome-binding protein